jgi:hypothetical protein
MALDTCPICGEFKFDWKRHRCEPGWWCWISDPEWDMERDDGQRIFAHDAQEAAEKYIEAWDNGDYVCIGGQEMIVSVDAISGESAGQVHVFSVHGEMIPHYHARRKNC